MKLLDEYFDKQKEIFEYFGYKEDWHVYPIEDRRDMYWILEDIQVCYAESKEQLPLTEELENNGNYYCDEIVADRFLSKKVFEKADFTAVLVDTHCDGNKFFAIYDNSKKVIDES